MSLLNVDSLKAVSGDTILIQSNLEMAPGKTFNAAGTGTSTVTIDNISGLPTAVIGKPYTISFVASTSLATSGGSITDFYVIRPDGIIDSVTAPANTGTASASYTLAGTYVTGSSGGTLDIIKVRARDSNGNVSAWTTKTVTLIQVNVLAPTISVANSTAVAKTGLNVTVGGIALSQAGYVGSSARIEWEVRSQAGGNGSVLASGTVNNPSSGTYSLNSGAVSSLQKNTQYFFRARHIDATYGDGAWGEADFTTLEIAFSSTFPTVVAPNQSLSVALTNNTPTQTYTATSSLAGTQPGISGSTLTYTVPLLATGSFTITVSAGGFSVTQTLSVSTVTVNAPSSVTIAGGVTNVPASFTISTSALALSSSTVSDTLSDIQWRIRASSGSTVDAASGINAGSSTSGVSINAVSSLLPNTAYILYVKHVGTTYGPSAETQVSFTTLDFSISGAQPSATSMYTGGTHTFALSTATTSPSFSAALTDSALGTVTVVGRAVTVSPTSAGTNALTVTLGGISKSFSFTVQSVGLDAPTITGITSDLGLTNNSFTASGMTRSLGIAIPTHLTWELFSDSACTKLAWTSGEVAVGTVTSNAATQTLTFSSPITPITPILMGGNYYLKVKWEDSTYGYSSPSNALTLTMLDIKVGGVTALAAYEGQSKAFSLDNTSITYTATVATISGTTVTYAAAVGATSGSFTVSSKGFTQTFNVTIQDVSVVTPTITVTGLNASNQITAYADVAVASSAFAISPSAVTGVSDTLASATLTLLDGTTSVWTDTGLTATIPATTFVFDKRYTLQLKHTGSKYGDSANAAQVVTFNAFRVTGASSVDTGNTATYTISGYNSSTVYTLSVSSGGGSVSAIGSDGTFIYTPGSVGGIYTLTATASGASASIFVNVSGRNNIGTAGTLGFGVGVYPGTLPIGMAEMSGCTDKANDNYGNYQYTDGSIMVYIPKFYYRWGISGTTPTALYTLYGDNSIEIKPASAYADETAANADGWGLHRAFIDGGVEKDGFWVDKYQWSATGTSPNKVASSVKLGNPLAMGYTNLFATVTANGQTPANAPYGAFAVAKTRGSSFFPYSVFQFNAMAMLSLAHAQACKVVNTAPATVCAWADLGLITSTSPGNFPKGCTTNTFSNHNDSTITFTGANNNYVSKAGSGVPFAKITHNGQNCGVADLVGNADEFAPGFTCDGTNFYVLKRSVAMRTLTGGTTVATDAWGSLGIAANYDSVGETLSMSAAGSVGNGNARAFSNQIIPGSAHALSCAGIPIATSPSGLAIFGNDQIRYHKTNDIATIVGGSTMSTAHYTGMWCITFGSRTYGAWNMGGRSGLYPA